MGLRDLKKMMAEHRRRSFDTPPLGRCCWSASTGVSSRSPSKCLDRRPGKRPSSSHFVAKIIPLPSKIRNRNLSARFDLKTKTSPLYGLPASPSETNATKPCTPLRKSTGSVATNTRVSDPNAITVSISVPKRYSEASRHLHPEVPAPARPQSRFRSCRSTTHCPPARRRSSQQKRVPPATAQTSACRAAPHVPGAATPKANPCAP